MSDSHGKFVWYELMTIDPKAAEAFYRSVVGWGAQDSGMPGMTYTLLTVGGVPAAGLMEMPERVSNSGAPPSFWTGYVYVDDVDASAAQAAGDGATVHHPPDDIPGVGRFAAISDPQGAAIALFKSTMTGGQTFAPGTPGSVGWHELYTVDREAAFAFYAKLFGWTKAEHFDMGPLGIYQLFAAGGDAIGGMMAKPPQVPVPCWLYYFNVEAIDAAVARVEAGGGRVLNGPFQVPRGSFIVQCVDPQGGPFCLVAPRR